MARRGIIGFSGFGEDQDATSCPEGQYGVPPYCFEPSSWLPGGAEAGEATYGQCPAGTIGIPPNCVAIPQEIPPLPTTQCPEGTIGIPPNCLPISQLPQLPPVVKCPDAATCWDVQAGQCLPVSSDPCGLHRNPQNGECLPVIQGCHSVVPPNGKQAAIEPVEQKTWWQQRSDTEKGLIIGGAVLGGIAVVLLIKRAASPSYASNEGDVAPAAAKPEEKPAEAATAAIVAKPNKRYMTKAQAERMWRQEVLPLVKKRYERRGVVDKPARRESWGEFVDMLQKDGMITRRQYDDWAHPKQLYRWNPKA